MAGLRAGALTFAISVIIGLLVMTLGLIGPVELLLWWAITITAVTVAWVRAARRERAHS